MDGWDLVFRAGEHTDSNGNKRIWTTDDLDKIVATFQPSFHEPPVVIGHPSDNAPAFGWVSGIKRVGESLYVQYRDVADEFREWVGKKLFKKKSISVYPDGRLRHVGYLGAMPPAIKGLPDYQFNDGDKGEAVTYEYSDWRMTTLGQIVMRIRDYLVEKEGAEKADTIIRGWEVQDLLTPPPEPEQSNRLFNEPKEEGMKPEEVQELVSKAVGTTAAQFAESMKVLGESVKGLSEKVDSLSKQLATEREAGQRREFREFLMTPEMQRRVAEGSREATINQMMALANAAPVSFGEGDQKKEIPALDHYKQQLRALPEVVSFSEFATGDRAAQITATTDAKKVGEKMDELMASAKAKGLTMSYAEAHTQACRELGIATGGAQ